MLVCIWWHICIGIRSHSFHRNCLYLHKWNSLLLFNEYHSVYMKTNEVLFNTKQIILSVYFLLQWRLIEKLSHMLFVPYMYRENHAIQCTYSMYSSILYNCCSICFSGGMCHCCWMWALYNSACERGWRE